MKKSGEPSFSSHSLPSSLKGLWGFQELLPLFLCLEILRTGPGFSAGEESLCYSVLEVVRFICFVGVSMLLISGRNSHPWINTLLSTDCHSKAAVQKTNIPNLRKLLKAMTETPKTFATAQKSSSVLAHIQASASWTDAGPQKHTQLNIQNFYIDTNNKAESIITHSHHTSLAQ